MALENPGRRLSGEFGQGARIAALALRILIGWHFLYEGLAKVLDPNWTSAGFLAQSRWILSEPYRWVASDPWRLWLVDWANIGALLAVGLLLMLGLWTRGACLAGIALLTLYYAANPALGGYQFGSPEGSYLLVDKNLVELGALVLLALLPAGSLIGMDRLLAARGKASKAALAAQPAYRHAVPLEENRFEWSFRGPAGRRELLKNLAVLPFFGGVVVAALKRHGWESFEERNLARVDAVSQASVRTASAATLDDLRGLAPTGRLGNLEVSRMIVGGNLISGFAHARDLIYVSPLLKTYFTDEKVMETLWLCESAGINTAILRTDGDTIRILDKYWKRGGKIQWLAQVYPRVEDVYGNIESAIDNGAIGAFLQGGIADTFVKEGRMDLVERSIERIRSRGVPAGIGGHALATVRMVEDSGVAPDFYMKTLHHDNYWSARRPDQYEDVVSNAADNYWSIAPLETAAYMGGLRRPWIAYKVLAAGAIPPEEGFRYAFENGADFICVGMFDFQVVENVNLLNSILNRGDLRRSRAWMA